MVVDANTGRVLHASAAEQSRYPASLTKLMTIYMALEAIEAGRASYHTRLRVSTEAATRPASKLGMKPGETIRLIDAIQALIVKSANDVAVVVAEHLAGSEARFAKLMTQKAHLLGMTKTTFRNASGLPDGGQVTTARDMLTLALRLHDHFPKHYRLFATKYFKWRGKTYKSYNGLLHRFSGTEGLKTGYIRASGFNLVASVRRGRRHVIGAIFGGRSAAKRDYAMRQLLTRALRLASTTKTRVPPPILVARAQPARRRSPSTYARAASTSIAGRPQLVRGPRRASYRATFAPHPTPRRPYRTVHRAGPRPEAGAASTGRQNQGLRGPFVAASRRGHGFEIQIGAYTTSREASMALASAKASAGDLLRSRPTRTEPISKRTQRYYRARFTGFSRQAAASTCQELRRRRFDCFVARAQ